MRAVAAARLLHVPLALIVLIAAPQPRPAQAGEPDTAARLRVWTYVTGPIGPAERDAALRIAEQLLTTAGVTVEWRLCDQPGGCPREEAAVLRVTMILTSAVRQKCGMTAFEPGGGSATIVVSVTCVGEAALRLRRRLSARAHPLLSRLETRHLLGAVVAHEVGHVLGLPHAAAGLMRAGLEPDDVLALRRGTLKFSAVEAARMRTVWSGLNRQVAEVRDR
jgi:hypothetical protein